MSKLKVLDRDVSVISVQEEDFICLTEIPDDYGQFLADLKVRIRQAQYRALRAANKELLQLYWDIGETILRKQEEVGWGKAVVETLARDLQAWSELEASDE